LYENSKPETLSCSSKLASSTAVCTSEAFVAEMTISISAARKFGDTTVNWVVSMSSSRANCAATSRLALNASSAPTLKPAGSSPMLTNCSIKVMGAPISGSVVAVVAVADVDDVVTTVVVVVAVRVVPVVVVVVDVVINGVVVVAVVDEDVAVVVVVDEDVAVVVVVDVTVAVLVVTVVVFVIVVSVVVLVVVLLVVVIVVVVVSGARVVGISRQASRICSTQSSGQSVPYSSP